MQFVSPCIGVEDKIILRELHENLCRALAKLNSNEKALLLARFHENKSQQDAAEEPGISQQAVSRWEKEKRCGGRTKTTCGRSPAINDGNKGHSGAVHSKAAVARCFATISSAYNAQPQTQAMGAAVMKKMMVPDMADILGIGLTKAYELSRQKGFPSLRLGRRILIPRNQFIAWVEEKASHFSGIL